MNLILNEDVHRRFEELMLHCFSDDAESNHSSFMSILLDCYENSYLKIDRSSEISLHSSITFSCPRCDSKLTSEDELSKHYCEKHSEDVTVCICGIFITDFHDFIKHLITCDSVKDVTEIIDIEETNRSSRINKTRSFVCLKCDKSFKSKPLLDQHMHIHYPPKYECKWCGNMYRWPPVYYHHKQKCQFRPIEKPSSPMNYETEVSHQRSSPFGDINANEVARSFLAVANMLNMNRSSSSHQDLINNIFLAKPLTCLCTMTFSDAETYREHFFKCPYVTIPLTQLNEQQRSEVITGDNEIIHDLSMNSGDQNIENMVYSSTPSQMSSAESPLDNRMKNNAKSNYNFKDFFPEDTRPTSATSNIPQQFAHQNLSLLAANQKNRNYYADLTHIVYSEMNNSKNCSNPLSTNGSSENECQLNLSRRLSPSSAASRTNNTNSTSQSTSKSGKKFFCRLCDKEFTSKLSIKQHIDGKHTSQGKYVCNTCGKRYRWGASFYYHRRTCGQNLSSFHHHTNFIDNSSSIVNPVKFALT